MDTEITEGTVEGRGTRTPNEGLIRPWQESTSRVLRMRSDHTPVNCCHSLGTSLFVLAN